MKPLCAPCFDRKVVASPATAVSGCGVAAPRGTGARPFRLTMEAPQKPSTEGANSMEPTKQHFLLLMSVSKVNANVAKKVLDSVKKKVDSGAAPLWIDAHGIGVFIESDLPAWKIWKEMKLEMPLDDWATVKDMLLLQVGPGWYATDNQTKPAAWLHARYPKPPGW
jgi:hypothetical protein